ncbi:unnamed protein product [Brassica oleracea var. botrytis]|uniref:Uncharacterized protein n=1 Tax=Brassica oleracea TaxID=3712 RepID=A0A3P6F7D3_BRAOL|nr:unnamed protein product [Brassica oleracea]
MKSKCGKMSPSLSILWKTTTSLETMRALLVFHNQIMVLF